MPQLSELQDLSVIIDTLPSLVAYVDADGIYRYANATFRAWFGCRQEEVIGRKVSEFLSDTQYQFAEPFLQRALSGETVGFEAEAWYPSSGTSYVSVCYAPDRAGSGEIRGAVILVNDVSYRRTVEAELERQRKLMQTVMDNAASGLIMLDKSSGACFMNLAAHRMTGYFLDDLRGHPLSDFLMPRAPEQSTTTSESLHFLQRLEKECRSMSRDDEFMKRKNGDSFPVSYTVTPLYEGSEHTGCVLEFQDISRIKALEASLRRAAEMAEAASRSKSEFLANMSHEIRTPMNSILGFADLLRNQDLTADERFDFTERICSNGSQLLLLVNDILDLSKFEAGKFNLRLEPIRLHELLVQTVQAFEPQAKKKDLGLVLEEEGLSSHGVISDFVRLRQILNNLVANAIKFTFRGQVTIRCRAQDHGDLLYVEIEVEDSGIGISEASRGNLFRAFGQADHSISRNYGGTGLGLILSRRLAKALDGDIELQWSEPAKGSRFIFTFCGKSAELTVPSPKLAESGRESAATPPAAIEDVSDPIRARVLLAEDSIDNEALVRQYLRGEQVALISVRTGLEALNQFSEGAFDLILMDVQMPGMDGLTATQKLRERGAKVPILALSAYALPEEIARSLQAGCNAHLTKPLSKASLCQALRAHLPTQRQHPTSESLKPRSPRQIHRSARRVRSRAQD